MTRSEQPLLTVRELTTYIHGPAGSVVRAVDGVDLTLERGQALGIVGESGSGKSMTVRSIMGLLPPRIIARRDGRVAFDGVDMISASKSERRRIWGRRIGLVSQDPGAALNPVIKVGRQVAEPLEYHLGMRRSSARRRAGELLELVGIPDPGRRLNEYPHQLSGGMRQRICIAMALACDPDLLVADEPTRSLDVTVQSQILDLLHAIRRQQGMALILISHDLAVVSGRTDEVAVMYAGRVVEAGPTNEVFDHMQMPYTAALFASIPLLADSPGMVLKEIPGRPPRGDQPMTGCPFAPRCEHVQADCESIRPELTPDPGSGDSGHVFACLHPLDIGRDHELI